MLIANPIYDYVFKRLMASQRLARFLIGTLIGETVEEVEPRTQELLFDKGLLGKDAPAILGNIMLMDFIATIKLQDGGYKKVLIEMQKAHNHVDIMRFRNYLASQYQTIDRVDGKETVLPIITIYFLGYNLPESDAACISIKRVYRDMLEQKEISGTIRFAEGLTHDSYIVQVNRIKPNYRSTLEKLLCYFEQDHFPSLYPTVKEFAHHADTEELKELTDLLHYLATNAEERAQIEKEREAMRILDLYVGDINQKLLEKDRALVEKDKIIEEKDKVLEEKDKALEEKDKALAQKEKEAEANKKALEERDRELAALRRFFEDKNNNS